MPSLRERLQIAANQTVKREHTRCQYLGREVGERPCLGCKGRTVLWKEFECLKKGVRVTFKDDCQFCKQESDGSDFTGRIVVIMPVRNEGEWARKTIRNLRARKAPGTDLHFAVFDDGSTDGCCRDFQRAKDITLFTSQQGANGQGVCRNLGVRLFRGARGYISIDGHMELRTQYGMEQMVLEAEKTGGIVGAQSWNIANGKAVGAGLQWQCDGSGESLRLKTGWAKNFKDRLVQVDLNGGAFYAWTEQTYDRLGGFGESYGYYGFFEKDLGINCRFLGIPIHVLTTVEAGHLYRGPRPYEMSGRWRWWGHIECLRQRFKPAIWKKVFEPSARWARTKLQDPMIEYLLGDPRLDVLQAVYEPKKVVSDEEVLAWMKIPL